MRTLYIIEEKEITKKHYGKRASGATSALRTMILRRQSRIAPRIHHSLLIIILALAFAVANTAFAKDRLAIFPFTGIEREDGETIVELFFFEEELIAVFTSVLALA